MLSRLGLKGAKERKGLLVCWAEAFGGGGGLGCARPPSSVASHHVERNAGLSSPSIEMNYSIGAERSCKLRPSASMREQADEGRSRGKRRRQRPQITTADGPQAAKAGRRRRQQSGMVQSYQSLQRASTGRREQDGQTGTACVRPRSERKRNERTRWRGAYLSCQRASAQGVGGKRHGPICAGLTGIGESGRPERKRDKVGATTAAPGQTGCRSRKANRQEREERR